MPARLTAYVPDQAAVVRLLEDEAVYRIGRASDCEIHVGHPSVSRFHAEITGQDGLWRVHDTGSKNGLRVDGQLVRVAEFRDGTWFSIGDVHCAFERLDQASAAAHREAGDDRRSRSHALSSQLRPDLGMSTLLPQTLDVVLQLSGLERGFVLFAGPGEALRVRASRGLKNEEIAANHFAGSAAAIDRALETGKSVVCTDTSDSPWLGTRPSVRLGGIRALVCVPLSMAGGATGVIYVDSRKPGPPVTELDLELVETIAGNACTAIEVARVQERIDDVVRALAREEAQAPLWQDLRRGAA
jgi:hypothetical protein